MKKKITVEQVMLHHMSIDINNWITDKGDDIDRYHTRMDRTCEINDVLKGSIEKALKVLKEYKPEENSIELEFFI
mgnify:FL=1